MNKQDLVEIRSFLPADRNFIMSTWLKGNRYGNDTMQLIDTRVYFETYQRVIDAILGLPSTSIRVACLKDDHEVILGYSILDVPRNAAHWCFVKSAWRGIGIAKSLIPVETNMITHVTKIGAAIMRKKNLQFNPFL